jgi:hypothetical protein
MRWIGPVVLAFASACARDVTVIADVPSGGIAAPAAIKPLRHYFAVNRVTPISIDVA